MSVPSEETLDLTVRAADLDDDIVTTFPVRIGQDLFLNKADGSLTDDLHQNLRDVK
jgi:hypothetical protein